MSTGLFHFLKKWRILIAFFIAIFFKLSLFKACYNQIIREVWMYILMDEKLMDLEHG